MKEREKLVLSFGIIIFVILVAYLVFASSDAAMSSPEIDTNYTTTFIFTATSDFNTTSAMDYNVTLYCNASGGDIDNASSTKLVTVSNTSADQNAFNDTAVSITGLADGTDYNCSAYADNGTDQNFSVAVANITIDNTAPSVTNFTDSTNGGNYSQTLILNVSSVDALMGLEVVYFSVTNASNDETNFTLATNLSDNQYYNFTVNSTEWEEGSYTVTVFANDTLNNVNSTESISITIDNSGPAASFVNLNSGNYSGNIIINATATDGRIVDSVYFNITNDTNDEVNLTAGTAAGSSYAFTLHQTSLVEGDYNITIFANDTLDNTNATERIQITIDNTVPNVSAFLNIENYQNYTSDVTINVTASENTTALASVYFNITNSAGTQVNWSAATNETADEGGAYVFILDDNTLEDGDYNVTAYASDSASPANVNSTEFVQFRIDNTAPAVTNFTMSIDGGNYSGNITLNVSAVDALMGLEVVYLNITNASTDQINFSLATNEGDGEYYNFTFNSDTWADDFYTVTVFANDTQLDNVNSTESITIMIDNSMAPLFVTPVTFTDNANFTGNLLLNASVVDYVGADTVFFNLTLADASAQNYSFPTSNDGNYWNSSVIDTSTYVDGTYNITIWANDTLGNLNESIGSYVVIFDNTYPSITLTRSDSSTPTSIVITTAVSDATSRVVSGASCTVDRTGAKVSGSGASQIITETGLTCGQSYSYIVTCSDEAGNNLTGTQSFLTGDCTGGGTGGSGGSSRVTGATYTLRGEYQLITGYTNQLKSGDQINFSLNQTAHLLQVASVSATSASITVSSTPQTATLLIGETKKFDVTNDDYYDLSVKLNSISSNKANLTLNKINEEIPEETREDEGSNSGYFTDTGAGDEGLKTTGSQEKTPLWVWLIVIVVVIAIASAIGYAIKRKKAKKSSH